MQLEFRWRGVCLAGAALLASAVLISQAANAQAAATAVPGQPVTAQSGARQWIQRMNQALATRNFDGVLKHSYGKHEQVLRIVHRIQDGEMIERVASTDGSGYEQRRKGSTFARYFPDLRQVEVSTRQRSFGFLPALNGIDALTTRHYDMVDAGKARLLGRDVQLIRLEAKDALRYGYRFWLDRQSAMPLKVQLVTQDGRVVKEIAFISPPALPDSISDDQLKVAVDTEGFRFVRRDRRTPMHNPELKRAYLPQAALLPPGYRTRTFNSPAEEAMAAGPRARFIVSDGISWADVFLAPANGEPPPARGIDMEPLATYLLRHGDVQVTVVGEVPLAAAKAIAEAVRPE